MTAGRPLKVGIQLPEVEREVPWAETRAMAQRAEQLGFDSLWLGDHLLYHYPDGQRRGPWEVWSTLAALAAVTRRVELGPLVACTSFHNPGVLAKKAAAVDEISGGRLILGLGAGWNETEYSAFGLPFDHRVARFEQAFTIIRVLLADGHVDFDGSYYQARDLDLLPRGPRPAGPPLMVGSVGPRMLRITLPHVAAWNGWYAWFANDVEQLRPLLARIDDACHEVGRNPAEVERTVAVLVQLRGGKGRLTLYEDDEPVEPLRGTPDDIAAALAAFAEAGVAHVQLVVDPITLESIEALAPTLEVLDRG